MFVCNFKLNKNFFSKLFLGIIFLIVIIILIATMYRLFHSNLTTVNDEVKYDNIKELTTSDYTNVLKAVHDDLDSYTGQRICFTGYVYRVYDLKQSEFVLARNMVISSDYQTLVVGFLCNYENALNYSDGTWVTVTGKISKGDYHGEIPIIEIEKIEKTEKPHDEYVYPPDDSFVPTSAIL